MKQKLQDDLKAAMKAGDKLRTMTIRGILSEITRIKRTSGARPTKPRSSR